MSLVLGTLALVIGSVGLLVQVWGNRRALRHLNDTPPYLDAPFGLYPISILKPLKGVDPGLEENLLSFFQLDYPLFELIFSVANPADPAAALVERMIQKYPRVRARLIRGERAVGINPKVNNMIQGYEQAKYDWILVSDSNVYASPDYLKRLMAHVDSSVGMVTSIVAGQHGAGLGGRLESTFLNTYYTRWMILAALGGKPCVVGKSMLFQKSTARRFGGMQALARYLAEDYMAGEAVRKLGLRVVVATDPIRQRVGEQSLRDFWSRHVRWGRIRKAQAPAAFFGEVLMGAFASALLFASGLQALFHVPFHVGFGLHYGIWALCDAVLLSRVEGGLSLLSGWFWTLREIVAIPLWFHTLSGSTVLWRGRKFRLVSGGLLEPLTASTGQVGK